MTKRIMALALIVVCTSMSWWYLSFVMGIRTAEASYAISDVVGGLWGTEHSQGAPRVVEWVAVIKKEMTEEEKFSYIKKKKIEEKLKAKRLRRRRHRIKVDEKEFIKTIKKPQTKPLELAGTKIDVRLNLNHRKKGLLWFATYKVDFSADYTIENPLKHPVEIVMAFPFPSDRAVYDNMSVSAPGLDNLQYITLKDRMIAQFTMAPKATQEMHFGYQSRGLDQWTYRFGDETGMIKNFSLAMHTDFDAIDFPRESISPDRKERHTDDSGWKLVWEKESLVSAFQIGMVMPHRLNPGPLASAMSSHAPVSLLFFFFLIFLLQVLRGIKIHPMNYFFLACAFFAFNLLFSYLVDHLDIKLSFIISSTVSILLVVSYLRLAVGTKFALVEAGISQFVYQILFSLAHFFEGYTGLAITIGAIISLAVVMHMTAKIDWEETFKDSEWGKWPRNRKPVATESEIV